MPSTGVVVRRPTLNENGVCVWENDDDVHQCALCGQQFTFFCRKHHCRKCGRIVCGSCSPISTTYLPNTYVVSPASQIFLESPQIPHRTCNECLGELDMLRQALRDESSTATPSSKGSPDIKLSAPQETTLEFSQDSSRIALTSDDNTDEDEDLCPVCGLDIEDMNEMDRVAHVNECLTNQEFAGSPNGIRQRNRMLVYTIPSDAKMDELNLNDDNECVICLEEFKPGDKIGRLECLCCFHYNCIKDWINRKGCTECPVHTIHYQ